MTGLARYIPALTWGRAYSRDDLPGDVMAGLITAIMLVPQSMAYAMLAGLPPVYGLSTAAVTARSGWSAWGTGAPK